MYMTQWEEFFYLFLVKKHNGGVGNEKVGTFFFFFFVGQRPYSHRAEAERCEL